MVELAKQIDSHMLVIEVDNLATTVVPEGQGTPQVNQAPTPSNANEVSLTTRLIFSIFFVFQIC